MSLFSAILCIAAGLALAVWGSSLLIAGASKLAQAFGIPPLIVGLTVVAWGTSMPELFVSVTSSLQGKSGLSLGNVVGSNLFNVLFILGVSALITPIMVVLRIVRNDLAIMVAASFLAWWLASDGLVSRIDGLLLLGGLVVWTGFLFRQARAEQPPEGAEEPAGQPNSRLRLAFMLLGGLVVLIGGSHLLLEGAIFIARAAGVEEKLIGLTLVAGGTSLPELFSSVTAAWRGDRDIAVGNVVGSNIFNLLAVLGVSSTIAGDVVADTFLPVDLPLMCVVALACFPVFYTGSQISRTEGALFLASWSCYVGWLYCSSSAPAAAPIARQVGLVLGGAALLALGLATARELRRRKRADAPPDA